MKVKGFTAAAVEAGIRYQNRLDLGLIYSEVPAIAAGVFTNNKVKAAPVILDIERLRQGKAQAIVVNSGIANACTGEQGMRAAVAMGQVISKQLNIDDEMVQVASTGVIGEQLNLSPIEKASPNLVANLSSGGFATVAQAIMTTDTVPKTCQRTVEIGGKDVSFYGMAKGSGMIMPDMATMLCFVVTDAQIAFSELRSILTETVNKTFNRITVDGDTSTNDTVLVLANGMAENKWVDDDYPEGIKKFASVLEDIFRDLALKIVADGEGATKVVTIKVVGAHEQEDAMSAAQTIANSSLVKTAFFGEDPNWGRIIAALGRSECRFSPDKVSLYFDDVRVMENGMGVGGEEVEKQAQKVMQKKQFTVLVEMQEGLGEAEVYTCDFSVDYVKINADYRS
ncbi:MAG: bifunctional glutamate N-acetyltransferase/amino-acid acetyltransferase ArgJ [Desulfobulbaceae bacterium]|nr:bifunctional glutamate N-acetyltransferase/amino-acid acetyltransferase ArgJ [Desulfobulbaceae bacterium]